eukprot:CFRG7430T1
MVHTMAMKPTTLLCTLLALSTAVHSAPSIVCEHMTEEQILQTQASANRIWNLTIQGSGSVCDLKYSPADDVLLTAPSNPCEQYIYHEQVEKLEAETMKKCEGLSATVQLPSPTQTITSPPMPSSTSEYEETEATDQSTDYYTTEELVYSSEYSEHLTRDESVSLNESEVLITETEYLISETVDLTTETGDLITETGDLVTETAGIESEAFESEIEFEVVSPEAFGSDLDFGIAVTEDTEQEFNQEFPTIQLQADMAVVKEVESIVDDISNALET